MNELLTAGVTQCQTHYGSTGLRLSSYNCGQLSKRRRQAGTAVAYARGHETHSQSAGRMDHASVFTVTKLWKLLRKSRVGDTAHYARCSNDNIWEDGAYKLAQWPRLEAQPTFVHFIGHAQQGDVWFEGL